VKSIRSITRFVLIVAPFIAAGFAWFLAIMPMTVESNVLQAATYTDGNAGQAIADSQWSNTLRETVVLLVAACLVLIIISTMHGIKLLRRYRRDHQAARYRREHPMSTTV
jgi:hypothetical protein